MAIELKRNTSDLSKAKAAFLLNFRSGTRTFVPEMVKEVEWVDKAFAIVLRDGQRHVESDPFVCYWMQTAVRIGVDGWAVGEHGFGIGG
jgi:hypothetical protein